jgi:hypothetical protein
LALLARERVVVVVVEMKVVVREVRVVVGEVRVGVGEVRVGGEVMVGAGVVVAGVGGLGGVAGVGGVGGWREWWRWWRWWESAHVVHNHWDSALASQHSYTVPSAILSAQMEGLMPPSKNDWQDTPEHHF